MKRILIIDDETNILLMLKKMLERAGYEIDLASNGEEGLRLFSNASFDLVITDIIMPEKEGLETIREMRKMQPEMKIIACQVAAKYQLIITWKLQRYSGPPELWKNLLPNRLWFLQ